MLNNGSWRYGVKAEGSERDDEQNLKVGMIGRLIKGYSTLMWEFSGLKEWKDGGGLSIFTAGSDRCFFMIGTSPPFSLI